MARRRPARGAVVRLHGERPQVRVPQAGGGHCGHEALRAAYTTWKPRRPQRHLVVNTHILEWSQTEAHAISDVVFLLQGKEGWAVQVVGRYDDQLRYEENAWRFSHRAAEFVA